jgi:hypothetical protein
MYFIVLRPYCRNGTVFALLLKTKTNSASYEESTMPTLLKDLLLGILLVCLMLVLTTIGHAATAL